MNTSLIKQTLEAHSTYLTPTLISSRCAETMMLFMFKTAYYVGRTESPFKLYLPAESFTEIKLEPIQTLTP